MWKYFLLTGNNRRHGRGMDRGMRLTSGGTSAESGK